MIFKKTEQEDLKFQFFTDKVEDVHSSLKEHISDVEIKDITKLKDNFKVKTDDFFREERKLNIAIIGAVKAGKSSFLNTMLFNGMEILPTAATPKTATLTKIEYSEENKLIIEYYSKEEWTVLEENAKLDLELDQVKVAKEIMNMVKTNGINPEDYVYKGEETIKFDSYEELTGSLNAYVGENGKLTPLVKSIILKIDNPNLKEISIVDTPGMNDPIASRTDKTKQFVEICDVVFFLSRASQFLDKNDMELLSMQLPQKGVKQLVLIASKYDEGLMDTIYDYDDLEAADVSTKTSLKRKARKDFEKAVEEYTARGFSKDIIEVISQCKNPVFISSMAYNMSNKETSQYDDAEKKVLENLSVNGELTGEELHNIGNIEQVKAILEEVVGQKEETLEKKSSSFIPDANLELKEYLLSMKAKTSEQIKLLSGNDRESLMEKKRFVNTKINEISSSVEIVFGELLVKLDRNKAEAIKALRNSGNEYGSLQDKQGKIQHTGTSEVSTSKWYNPFSWGSSRTQTYTYYEYYNYLETSDALENLRCCANESANFVEDVFNTAINVAELKRKLLTVILQNMDTADDSYDPSYFKLMAERTLNEIQIPIISIDVSDYIKDIASKFSGEIKDTKQKEDLKNLLASSISEFFDVMSQKLINELKVFTNEINKIKESFSDKLLENINSDFNLIIEQLENKEEEISRSKKLIAILEDKLINLM